MLRYLIAINLVLLSFSLNAENIVIDYVLYNEQPKTIEEIVAEEEKEQKEKEKEKESLEKSQKKKDHDESFSITDLSYFDIVKEKDREDYEKYKDAEVEELSFSKLISRLLVYKALKHYDEKIEAFLKKHPYLERIIDRIDVTKDSINVIIFENEF